MAARNCRYVLQLLYSVTDRKLECGTKLKLEGAETNGAKTGQGSQALDWLLERQETGMIVVLRHEKMRTDNEAVNDATEATDG